MAKKEKMLATKSGRKNVINCIIALIIAVVFLFPIYWILAMSFKTDAESFGKIVTYYPHEFTIDPMRDTPFPFFSPIICFVER